MSSAWIVDGKEVELALQGKPEPFTAFVDALIRADAWFCGIKESSIHTNARITIKDGGVDTKVDEGSTSDKSGHLEVPSVWQYKSGGWGDVADAELAKLLDGRPATTTTTGATTSPKAPQYLLERIHAGDALRICIPECRPAKDVEDRTKKLIEMLVARGVPSDKAKLAQILSADQLATWASRIPSIVVAFFRPALGSALDYMTWGKRAKDPIGSYIDNPASNGAGQLIRDHIELSRPVTTAVTRLLGPAGVGKTRFIFEKLSGDKRVEALVVYLDDEKEALALAQHLQRDAKTRAIIVADECLLEMHRKIESVLTGHSDRVRVITIDNSGQEPTPDGAPRPRLTKLSEAHLLEILKANFGHVPEERRRSIAALCDGFVRVAAFMCQDPVTPIPARLDDYLQDTRVLRTEDRETLAALSLMTHLLKGEIDAFEKAIEFPELWKRAIWVKERTGFAVVGEHIYVTPNAVAHALLGEAWTVFIAKAPDRILAALDKVGLLSRLNVRFNEVHGLKEERRILGAYFRRKVEAISLSDLTDAAVARRTAEAIETDPAALLPLLRSKLEKATHEELLSIHGEPALVRDIGDPGWGPRRYLVWLAERLAAFTEYYDDASRILLLLASAETELGVGNNAAGIWTRLHGLYLSGTEVPPPRRLDNLARIVTRDRAPLRELVLPAIEAVLEHPAPQMVGREVVAGRLVPPEWRPQKRSDETSAEEGALDLLDRIVKTPNDPLVPEAKSLAEKVAWWVIPRGHVRRIRAILGTPRGSDGAALRATLVDVIDRSRLTSETRTEVEAWIADLAPTTLIERIDEVLAVSPFVGEKVDHSRTDAVARELYEAGVTPHIERLVSAAPRGGTGGALLGAAVAKLDAPAGLLPALSTAALQRKYVSPFVQGYVREVSSRPAALSPLLRALDAPDADAATVLELAMVVGPPAKPAERAIEAVSKGKLPHGALRSVVALVYSSEVTASELVTATTLLVRDGDAPRVALALDLLHAWLRVRHQAKAEGFGDPALTAIAWDSISWRPPEERAFRRGGPSGNYDWCAILQAVAAEDPTRASRLIVAALADHLRPDRHLLEVALEVATHSLPIFLDELGKFLRAREGAVFFFGDYRAFVSQLPEEALRDWIEREGVVVARALARHLPRPFIDNGNPTVPMLTRAVLEKFGEDDRVFREFLVGFEGIEMRVIETPGEHEEQAANLARQFLDDPMPAVRKWAAELLRISLAEAEEERLRAERESLERRS